MTLIGTSIGNIRIVDHLGKGGMGEVYRSIDTKLGREIALKVLPAELSADSGRLRRFQRVRFSFFRCLCFDILLLRHLRSDPILSFTSAITGSRTWSFKLRSAVIGSPAGGS